MIHYGGQPADWLNMPMRAIEIFWRTAARHQHRQQLLAAIAAQVPYMSTDDRRQFFDELQGHAGIDRMRRPSLTPEQAAAKLAGMGIGMSVGD